MEILEQIENISNFINEEISTADQLLDEFVVEYQEKIENATKMHNSRMSSYKEKEKRLITQYQQLEDKSVNLGKEFSKENEIIKSERGQLETMRNINKVNRNDLSGKKLQLNEKETEIEALRVTLGNLQLSYNYLKKDLEEQINCFKDRTGLKFEKLKDGSLKIHFLQMEQESPVESFLILKLDENNNYKVLNNPLPVSILQKHVDDLNESNHFAHFVRAIRQEFRSMYGC